MYPKINPSFASAFVGWHGIFIFFLNYVYVDGWIGWMDWMNGWMDVGQVSRALAPYVAQLVGVDISPRMVEVYNTRANTQGLEPHEMRAVNSLAELHQEQCFDLAVVRTITYTSLLTYKLTVIVIHACHIVSCCVLVFDGVPPFRFGRTNHA
jgi:SAM-dependent methyltransferase